MSEFVLKPKDEEHKLEAKVPDVQFDNLEDEIEGAERADGKDQVAKALLEVKVGAAQPEALLEWIDDLRDPDEQEHEVDEEKVERARFAADFIPDTARDNAATENPPNDDFVFFSANRRNGGDDDDEGDLGGGGGGGGDGGGEGDDGGDESAAADPKDPKDSKKSPGTPAKAKPSKSDAKQPPKAEPPPPSKGGGGKKPDGK